MEPLRQSHRAASPNGPELIGRSPAFSAMLALVVRVGPSMATVLLLGESGTGKELVTRAVHEASPRTARPLVAVYCSSLPETLFESELCGHERGAFTLNPAVGRARAGRHRARGQGANHSHGARHGEDL
jgi:transcriptional regulator with GAF, ATPase, and Fis domain